MATVTLTVPDPAYKLLQDRYGADLSVWLGRFLAEQAQDIRNDSAKRRLPELLKNEAFMAELVPLVRKHSP